MSVWFQGESEIGSDLDAVKQAVENCGELYVGIIRLMPGLTSVELVDHGVDSVTIRTNEGLMERTNISEYVEPDRVVVEFDETYEAGSKVTVTSHYFDEFTPSDTGVTHRLVMTDVEAPGFLGFLYRRFGSSKTGNATLSAYKAYLEHKDG